MSKIVTFDQAKRLKKLGFNKECDDIYWTDGSKDLEEGYGKFDWNNQSEEPCISAPSVHESLDWIREEKGIDCCVFFNNELFGNLDNAKAIYYFKYGCNGRMIYNSWNVDYKSFDTHSLAESALLDAVLTYLEKK